MERVITKRELIEMYISADTMDMQDFLGMLIEKSNIGLTPNPTRFLVSDKSTILVI